mmetsp:Transcript_64997/g.172016  ORF Transcript_64997/g.172016 Transcript_64997/m.172016 type:complete len:313 (-) Transcript_64997:278-1216(-)
MQDPEGAQRPQPPSRRVRGCRASLPPALPYSTFSQKSRHRAIVDQVEAAGSGCFVTLLFGHIHHTHGNVRPLCRSSGTRQTKTAILSMRSLCHAQQLASKDFGMRHLCVAHRIAIHNTDHAHAVSRLHTDKELVLEPHKLGVEHICRTRAQLPSANVQRHAEIALHHQTRKRHLNFADFKDEAVESHSSSRPLTTHCRLQPSGWCSGYRNLTTAEGATRERVRADGDDHSSKGYKLTTQQHGPTHQSRSSDLLHTRFLTCLLNELQGLFLTRGKKGTSSAPEFQLLSEIGSLCGQALVFVCLGKRCNGLRHT